MNIEIIEVDFESSTQGHDLGYLLDCYARDPMGGGTPLAAGIRDNLATALSKCPFAFSVIAYVENKPAGLINCFEGFSTFKCKPLVNIHDVVVLEEFRGLGLSQLMLEKVEQISRRKGCCKLTLEVLDGNKVAQASYIKFGFDSFELDPKMGKAQFWQKLL